MSTSAPSAGDLVWLDFSPTLGSEQTGRRPALVISATRYNRKTGLMLVCPITSKVKGYPFEVAMPPEGAISGVALADQVRCIDWRARNAESAGRVSAGILGQARAMLGAILEFPQA